VVVIATLSIACDLIACDLFTSKRRYVVANEISSAGSGVDDLICFSVYSTGLAFNRVYKPLLDELGLTYPQYLVMVALWAQNDQTVSSLGDHLFLESNTLTPLLKRIESMGYIVRSRDAEDERIVRVRLTPKGTALRDQFGRICSCVLEATGLSEPELKRLHTTMRKLRRHLRES
jgi:MarR family transcriptional regulator, organic hydroperoxide resistance regulator